MSGPDGSDEFTQVLSGVSFLRSLLVLFITTITAHFVVLKAEGGQPPVSTSNANRSTCLPMKHVPENRLRFDAL